MGLAVRRILQRRSVAVRAQQVADALALRVIERGRTVLAAQALVRAIHPDRPLDVEAIRRESGVELVGHRAVEVAVVLAGVGAQLAEIEACVERFERIHRPGHDLDALVQAVIALGLLQREREPAPAVRATDGEHVRVVPEVEVIDAEEAEHEAGRPLIPIDVAKTDEAPVVDDGEHELRGHRDVAAPHLVLDRDGERAGGDIGRGLDPVRHGAPQYRAIQTVGYAPAAWPTTLNS